MRFFSWRLLSKCPGVCSNPGADSCQLQIKLLLRLSRLHSVLCYQHMHQIPIQRMIMKPLRVLLSVTLMILMHAGCTMITSWKSIPPPGGCDQCHTVAISNDWKISYQPPILSDETGKLAFQTPAYTMPQGDRQESSLEVRKVQDLKCFECHRSPSPVHKGRTGRFHH